MIHDEIQKPQLRLILPTLDDLELAELCDWSESLQTRHGIAAPQFCGWLDAAVDHEYRRRQSDGQIEAGSEPLPEMAPAEVSTMLLVLSARSYAPQGEQVAKFFDDVLMHVLGLAAIQLLEFQALCEAIQEQAKGE